jgi:subtilisin-like proprotein convertase family protein
MQSNYYHGIRRFPRAPITFTGGPNNMPHNPFTFKHLNGSCDTTLGTTTTAVSSAFPRNPAVSTSSGTQACNQVHNGGEVWSSMLWEVRNRMVSRLGFNAGTTRVLQVVTDGMKLSPLNPTFLQARDAIIAAAAALPVAPEASADVFDVREGFRARGMGFSASIQNANTGGTANATAVTEAFDVPNAVFVDPIAVSDATGDNDGFPEPGENITVSVPVTNNSGSGVINNVVANITGGGSANYGTVADGQTVVRNINYTVPANAACGSVHQITITGSSDIGAMNPRQHSFQLGAPVGGAPATFTSSTATRIPGTGTIGVADVYPNNLTVSGLTGNKKIKLELTNLSTTYPGDMDLLLVGPGGQKFVVFSDGVNAFATQTNATVVFKDDAAAVIPTASTQMAGEWRPTDHNVAPADAWAAPAPAGPYSSPAPTGSATFASVFGTNGTNLNGTWSLYAVDDTSGDFATIAGWKLTFEANDFVCQVDQPPTAVESRADFDNDGKTDFSVFRPSEGNWYLNQSTAGFGVIKWGISTDVLTPGDFNGDNKTDFAIFRANADATQPDFYILNSGTFTVSGVSWGIPGDIPMIRDYDGDDKEDIAVFRPSDNTWYILKSGGGATYSVFGQAGDVPVAGDFDGDGKGDLTVYRAGSWFMQFSSGGTAVVPFGQSGDILVPADYDGDNKDDIAVFRPSNGTWIYQPSTGGAAVFAPWGAAGDVPAPGDYDGDGKDDQAIYRNGQWWVNKSTGGVTVANFGLASDKAVPRSYVP